MNRKELETSKSELLDKISTLKSKLDDATKEYDRVNNELERKADIKKNYKLNDVSSRIEYDYELIFKNLVKFLEQSNDQVILDHINYLMKRYQTNYGPDPTKLYVCPECGKSDVLYIGEYGFDEYDREYAVTCSNCDFVGPKISDYGEAWCEFKDWLYKKGYLKKG